MFPTPIAKTSAPTRIAYRIALPVALIVWLLPLIAVMLTSIRSLEDINQGNYWGWPSEIHMIENYLAVFGAGPMGRYLINSLVVTIPTVLGTIAISTMAGTALALYRYRLAIPLFAMFIAGNFIPFQILMIPVRDLMVRLGMYDTYGSLILFHIAFQTGFCTLFMRNFIKALPFELIEAARTLGISEFEIFWKVVVPLVRPAMAALAVLVFTFIWNDYFLGAGAGAVGRGAADHSGPQCAQGPMGCLLAAHFGGLGCRGPAACGDVLCHAAPFHCRPDARRDQGIGGRDGRDQARGRAQVIRQGRGDQGCRSRHRGE